MRTLKAIIDEKGHVELLEPLNLSHKRRALVTILEPEVRGLRPFGLCKGDFCVPDNFGIPVEVLPHVE